MKFGQMTMGKLEAGSAVRIFAEAQVVFIQQAKKMDARDFNWDLIQDLARHLKLPPDAADGYMSKLSGIEKAFDDATTLGVIGGQVFTPDQVEEGCLLNLGTNDRPMVFRPFFAHPELTLGTVLDRYEPDVAACIEAAKKHGAITGTWRRILFNGNRGQVYCD